MIRYSSMLFLLCVNTTPLAAQVAQPFGDVSLDSPYYTATKIMYNSGITLGCSTGSPPNFCPLSTVPRWSLAVLVIRTYTYAQTGQVSSFAYSTTPYYSDVPSNDAYFSYIQALTDLGITHGTVAPQYNNGVLVPSSGTFGRDLTASNKDIAVFAVRTQQLLRNGSINNSMSCPTDFSCTPYFNDVPSTDANFQWVQKIRDLSGPTANIDCGSSNYCLSSDAARDQVAIQLMLGTIGRSNPVWSGVMLQGQEVSYFRYTGGPTIEYAPAQGFSGSTDPVTLANTPRPPYKYNFSTIALSGSALRVATCPFQNRTDIQPNVYWYVNGQNVGDPSNQYHHTIPAPPTEFNVSRLESGIKGIQVFGSFDGSGSGSPSGSYAQETFYYTDNACTEAGREFGFIRELTNNTTRFYYSDHTNCGAGQCRTTDSPSGPTIDARVDEKYYISNLQSNSQGNMSFYYNAWLIKDVASPKGYKFRVEVVDPNYSLAKCQLWNASGVSDCSFDVVPNLDLPPDKAWYEANIVFGSTGYLSTVIQAGGNPNLTNSPGLSVQSTSVGK